MCVYVYSTHMDTLIGRLEGIRRRTVWPQARPIRRIARASLSASSRHRTFYCLAPDPSGRVLGIWRADVTQSSDCSRVHGGMQGACVEAKLLKSQRRLGRSHPSTRLPRQHTQVFVYVFTDVAGRALRLYAV